MSRSLSSDSRTIVLTGGNSGLGYEAAVAILKSQEGPWHLVLPVRDPERGRAAVEALSAVARPGNTVEAMPMDLSSLASVRAFAAELSTGLESARFPRLHALVCNAGVQMGTNVIETVDGFESTFGVNHLGHFVLVNELLPALRSPGRVVVTASDVHDPAHGLPGAPAWSGAQALARGELGPSAAGDNAFIAGQRRYSTSKLANVYFTYALARRLPDGVTANAFNPGMVVGTGLGRSLPAPVKFLSTYIFPRITWLLRRAVTPNINTAEEAGGALAWLVTAPELADITGRYFDGRRDTRSSEDSYDVARGEDLWNDSVVLTANVGVR